MGYHSSRFPSRDISDAVANGAPSLPQLMVGYLIFASANLLGYTGGFVVLTALEVYNTVLDWPSFVFLMYNFAIVGVVAVFWQKVLHFFSFIASGQGFFSLW